MKIGLFAIKGFLPYIKHYLEEDGHEVVINKFHPNLDLIIVENRYQMYEIYRYLKIIKKNKIKLINFINDIPFLYFQKGSELNSVKNLFRQFFYHHIHKNSFFYNIFYRNKDYSIQNKGFLKKLLIYIKDQVNKPVRNRLFFQIHYKHYLKKADLNLAISKFTQKCVEKFLKMKVPVCYQCVNSDYLNSLKKEKNIYDAINISRIVPYKRQEIFVRAAKSLGLNFLIIGYHQDKSIKLDCKHYYLPNNKDVFNLLNKSKFYVDCSIFEGFGMTPVEAAFLDKISIVSDTYIHREILGDYPLYFNPDDVNDLINKMKIILKGEYLLNNKKIKEKYSCLAFKQRLMKHMEKII